ncbi:hypothetical protein C8Q79DRAFT_295278 [Trametes meyenii]|nr:hypothetical protein C8Q79DRAFT_295278 [Trametes meyenii]
MAKCAPPVVVRAPRSAFISDGEAVCENPRSRAEAGPRHLAGLARGRRGLSRAPACHRVSLPADLPPRWFLRMELLGDAHARVGREVLERPKLALPLIILRTDRLGFISGSPASRLHVYKPSAIRCGSLAPRLCTRRHHHLLYRASPYIARALPTTLTTIPVMIRHDPWSSTPTTTSLSLFLAAAHFPFTNADIRRARIRAAPRPAFHSPKTHAERASRGSSPASGAGRLVLVLRMGSHAALGALAPVRRARGATADGDGRLLVSSRRSFTLVV